MWRELTSFYRNVFHNLLIFFFFNDTATTEIYTLSLHDALPISTMSASVASSASTVSATFTARRLTCFPRSRAVLDRKSTRLNSSHLGISYAVFCLKKKKYEPYKSKWPHADNGLCTVNGQTDDVS